MPEQECRKERMQSHWASVDPIMGGGGGILKAIGKGLLGRITANLPDVQISLNSAVEA